MSNGSPDEDGGGGCGMLLAGFLVLGLVVTYWVQILVMVVAIGLIAAGIWWVNLAMERSLERHHCPVCQHWSASVILTDLGHGDRRRKDDLCRTHRPVYERIRTLEDEAFPSRED